MLAQVLWRQIVYQHKHHDKVERGTIPQGTIVFVASVNENTATVIYEELVLVVSRTALCFLESEQDIISIEELQKKYHNNRNSPCLLR
jgi:hypothetical protein